MTTNTDVWRKEIWLCDFGSGVGSEQKGIRPCIITSLDTNNYYSSNVTVVAVTSKIKNELPVHVKLPAVDYNLNMDSWVLVETIRSISKERLIKKIGEIDNKKMEEINTAIQIQNGIIEIPMPRVVRERRQLAFA